jgi:UDP-glucose 4-epimerase
MDVKTTMFPHQLQGQKILVTGASGFIGSHLCQRLCQGDVEVHAISRVNPPNAESVVHWWQGDLAELETVENLLADIKPEVIFHLASYVVGAREINVVMPTFRNNLVSTVNLLTVAGQIGCRRIVITGSLEEPEPNNHEAVPSSPYAAAKWTGSAYARMFHALYHLPVVNLRVFMVYGPGQRDLRKLIPYVILSLLRGEAPRLSSGTREVDWVYVEDVVEGFLAAAQAVNVEGQTVDIGSGALVPIRSVVEILVRLINPQIEPLFSALPDRPFEQVRLADIAKSQAMLGWRPKIALEEGLRRTAHWYERLLSETAL